MGEALQVAQRADSAVTLLGELDLADVQNLKLRQSAQVFQSGAGGGRVIQVKLPKLAQVLQMRQARIGDQGLGKIEHLELLQRGKVLQTIVGQGCLAEVQIE